MIPYARTHEEIMQTADASRDHGVDAGHATTLFAGCGGRAARHNTSARRAHARRNGAASGATLENGIGK